MTGRTLGRYRLIELVGAGGMGEVYRARDERLDRDVAVKVLPPAVATDADRLARFEREARALAKLEHPNILAIHDFGTDGDVAYSVTELLTGETLRARLSRERLPWRKSVELAAAIAEGLAAAHAQGVVHRDIKPDNLFLTTDGRVKILDFGLAATGPTVLANATTMTQAGAVTAPGVLLGTVGYMAPEQVESGHASARSDIFALGCVLYELLTGQRAFSRATVTETLAAILSAPVPDVSASGSDAPPELGRIVRRCVEKQPDERFQSATDLAFALRSTLGGGDAVAAASTAIAAKRPTARKRLWVTVAVSLLVVVGAGSWWWMQRAALDPSDNKIVVAVFRNQTGDPSLDALGFLVSEGVTNGLSRLPGVAVALNPDVSSGLSAAIASRLEPEELGRHTGARLVLDGSYYLDGERLRLDARFVRVGGGTSAMTVDPIYGARATPGDVVKELTSRVMGAVAVETTAIELATAVGFVRAPRYEALQERILGSRNVYLDNATARKHYLRALELDPNYYEAKQGLVLASENREEAIKWLDVIRDGYASLAPWQQLRYRVLRAVREGRLAESVAAAQQLVALDPSSPHFLLDLALAEQSVNHPRRAFEAAARVRPVARPAEVGAATGAWLRLLADISHVLEDDRAALEYAVEGQRKYPQDGPFLSSEINALVGLGRIQDVDAVLARASSPSLRSGDPGSILAAASDELRVHGYRDAAMAVAARGVEFRRSQLDPRKPSTAQRRNVAGHLMRAERWKEAYSIYSTLVGEEPDDLSGRGSMGVAAARVGQIAVARRCEVFLAQVNRPYLLGEHQYQRARVLAALGEGDGAVAALTLAYGQGLSWSTLGIHRDIAFDPIRDYPPFKEFIKPKG